MLAIYFQTLFSFRSYRRLAQLGAWRLFFFALYLLLLGVLAFNLYFSAQVNKNLPAFLRAFPAVTFEKGVLTGPDKAVSVQIPQTDLSVVFDAKATQPPAREQFISRRWLAYVSGPYVYTPSTAGVSRQRLPAQLDFAVTPQLLAKHKNDVKSVLLGAAFFGSFLGVGLYLVFSFDLAWAVLFMWRAGSRRAVPAAVLLRWALLLQGPALTLWAVNLFFTVPLFLFALFILFIIYTQQIFNTLAEGDQQDAS